MIQKKTLPIIPIKALPFFASIDKKDEWYGLLPEIIDIQFQWIEQQKASLNLSSQYKPYFTYALQLWRETVVVAGNNYNYFAVQSLRAILERIALIHCLNPEFEADINQLVADFQSNIRTTRVRATQTIMDFTENQDSDFKLLYDMLSRYFGHVSNLDLIRINQELNNSQLLVVRSQLIPLILILEVGFCMVNCITKLLVAQGKNAPELTGGRKPLFSYSLEKYIRLSTYLMCEKHSRNNSIDVRMLFKNDKDIQGEIGINDLYRGGMEIARFGDMKQKPEIKEIAGYGIFALGKNKEEHVKVKVIKESKGGEIYELSWPKHLEIDGSLIGMIAGQTKSDKIHLFDFISDFIQVVNR